MRIVHRYFSKPMRTPKLTSTILESISSCTFCGRKIRLAGTGNV
jgi:hypothetical protein